MKKIIIQTKDRDVYDKLNLLNFQNEVIINNVLNQPMGRIVKSINRKNNNIEMKREGKKHILKKINPINLDIYYRGGWE